MTPGFAEYTSGSSSFVNLVASPLFFLLQLGINLAMYTVGALLVREAMVRWNKGWPTAIALGAAYAIMEEGIADQTIFTPSVQHAPLGAAGVYGYFAGIDWTWLPDIFVIHILLSITIPIVLLGYALPETRGQRLLSNTQLKVAVLILVLDTAFLTAFVVAVVHFWYGDGLLLASIGAIAALCYLGYRLPRDLFHFRPGPPTASRGSFYVVGALIYPLQVFFAVLGSGKQVYPPLVFLAIALPPVLAFFWFVAHIGSERNERQVIAFALGTLTLGMFLGVVLEFPFEIVALFDAAIIYFLWRLDRRFARVEAPAWPAGGLVAPPPPSPSAASPP